MPLQNGGGVAAAGLCNGGPGSGGPGHGGGAGGGRRGVKRSHDESNIQQERNDGTSGN